jgi:hypothetical protein
MKRTLRIVNGQAVWDPPFTPEDQARHKARFQEMLDTGQAPTLVTDNTFWEGQWERNAYLGHLHAEQAKKSGVDITGKSYVSGLAEYPGDPRAFVSGRGDIRRICEERGYGCEGAVTVAPVQVEPERVDLDPALVKAEVDSIIADHPEPQAVNREELTEKVTNLRKPHWAK